MTEETLLEFPCQFPVKAMGKINSDLEIIVIDIIRRHAPDTEEDSMRINPSKNGNFLSVTVTIQATSKQQLDAIYYDLTAHPVVLVAL